MTVNRLLLFAALVLFILSALALFTIISAWSVPTALGLAVTGLGCWVAAGLV